MDLSTLKVDSLSGMHTARSLILKSRKLATDSPLFVDFSEVSNIYPNGAVPFAIVYQFLLAHNHKIGLLGYDRFIEATRIIDPPFATAEELNKGPVKNIVWRYTLDQTHLLADRFVEFLAENISCAPSTLPSLSWCLYEIMDNVFWHSGSDTGYAMMQIHKDHPWCAITIGDDGMGVLHSFENGHVYRAKKDYMKNGLTELDEKPSDEYEALKLAINQSITSRAGNMGNGLYGLARVVGLNKGQMSIYSGTGHLDYKDERFTGSDTKKCPTLEQPNHAGMVVDWQLDLSSSVDINDVLETSKYEDVLLEKIIDDNDEYRVKIRDLGPDIATRGSAAKTRTRLVNYLNAGAPYLVLDFQGVNLVSSSFADEVLGKLAVELGTEPFQRRIKYDNLSQIVEGIIKRAIHQRRTEGNTV